MKASSESNYLFFNLLTSFTDTIIPPGMQLRASTDTIRSASDTSRRVNDTTIVREFSLDSIKISKDSLDAPIKYAASDSGVLIFATKRFLLYGKARTEYRDLSLDAGFMQYDQQSQTVTAYGVKDSTDPYAKATLKQGGTTSMSDTIIYSLKTQRGLTKNTFYQEDDYFVQSERLKKFTEDGNDVVFAYRNQFTTCNLDTPHFAFRTKKMKLISNKLAVSGPAHPEFEGVPVPIYLPFGIYPMKRGRHSGILPPQFTANEDFGLGIEGLGYYKAISDYVDVTVRTNLYSYGGWNLYINPKYMKRYRYTGNFNLSIQRTKLLNRSIDIKDEFTVGNSFMVNWSHARDNKARPGTNFSASVNAGSTKFNQYVPNNTLLNFQNQLSSSIQWSKTTPKTNITVAANHDQNNYNRIINLRVPSVTFSALTMYPFQKKERVGSEKWYEKLGLSYNGTLQNQFSFYDSAINFNQLMDTLQWGINHNIPITLALPSLGPVTLAPSINFSERWIGRRVTMQWNETTKRVDTTYTKGFYTPREVSMGISANSRIFGTYQFGRNASVQAIRHEVRPTIGLSYKPDLGKKYFHTIQVDTFGNTQRYSELSTGLFGGGVSEGKFGGITYGVDNLLEMKVKDRKLAEDSTVPTKKIRLIDGFGFSGGYNLAVDSFQWSPISLYLRSTLFEKVNITAQASLDPYEVNAQGFRTKELKWTGDKFSLGTISSGSIAASANFQSKKAEGKDKQLPQDQYMTPDEQQRMLDYVRNNPAEFTDFDIPWSTQLSLSLNFYRSFDPSIGKFRTNTNANLYVNGDFSLTPKWKIGGSSYFDITTKKIQSLSMFVTRDMHCWQMAINITPVGLYRSFNITLNPKSGLLRDLRINRSRFFYTQ